jgi:hypothetical protein
MNIPEHYQIRILQLFYKIETFVWYYVFAVIGQFHFVYRLHKGKVENLTVKFLLGLLKDDFKSNSIFYVKTITANSSDHLICTSIKKTFSEKQHTQEQSQPKRKNITLLWENNPVDFDLTILDKIKRNSLGNQNILLSEIFVLTQIKCDTIKITKICPFEISVKKVDEISLHDLYE